MGPPRRSDARSKGRRVPARCRDRSFCRSIRPRRTVEGTYRHGLCKFFLCGSVDGFAYFFPSGQMIVASGTGTTAYFLANYFATHQPSCVDKRVEVLAAPCVGSCDYLKEQMRALDALSGSSSIYPTVLSTKSAPRRPFAKPNTEHFRIWKELQSQAGVDFDLIYAPRTFEVLTSQGSSAGKSASSLQYFMSEANLIYYHCGGTEGNDSQLDRYLAAGLF